MERNSGLEEGARGRKRPAPLAGKLMYHDIDSGLSIARCQTERVSHCPFSRCIMPATNTEPAPAASSNETDSRAGVTSDSSDPNKAHSSSGNAGDPQGARRGGGTYPEPSTFVERVMHVLENDLAPDAIWWVDDGNGIAIHPEEMKTSGLLAKFFSRNRFATFVRTLTRWYVCCFSSASETGTQATTPQTAYDLILIM